MTSHTTLGRTMYLLAALGALAPAAAAQAQSDAPSDSLQSSALAEPPEVLTIEEAARLLRIEPAMLAALVENGLVPSRQLGQDLRFSRAALLGWLAGYESGREATGNAQARAVMDTQADSARATALALAEAAASIPQDPGQSPTETIGAAPQGRTASEIFLRDQRVLLNRNELTVDLGFAYARSDNLVLLDSPSGPTLGLVESDTFGSVIVGRYSLDGETELFVNTSYRDQSVAIIAGGAVVSEASRRDLGDIGFGARRTLINEAAGRPDVIVSIEGGIPTGNGAYSVAGGITLVKSYDPAVLFGSVEYRRSFGQDSDDFTQLRPRDRIDAQIGYAYALNDTIILNTALSGSFNFASSFAQAEIRQSETFDLLLGLTGRISPNVFVQPSVAYRLNGPGNGVIFGLNFPITFGR